MTENYGMDLDQNQDEDLDTSSFDLDVTNPENDVADSSRPINKSMLIAEIIDTHPDIIPMIMDYGLHCIGCSVNAFETLQEGFIGHGVSDDEVDRIVNKLNALIKKNSEDNS